MDQISTFTSLQAAAFLTATLYPSVVFGIGFFINLFIWGKHSSGAIPFLTILGVVAMWFGISLPLVFLGYFFGYRKQPYEHPVRTNQIPRQVPTQVSQGGRNTKNRTLGLNVCLLGLVHASSSMHADGRNPPLWSLLH